MKLLLTIAYDGAGYDGWQSQPSGRGVQDQVERVLAQLLRESLRIEGASRTDAGVHAHAMPAHFEIPEDRLRMPVRQLPLALNHFLPADVRVMSAKRVDPDFHARFDARGKVYHYRLWNHSAAHPLIRNQAWHIPRKLDREAMRQAASLLLGTHDFRAFTVTCPGALKDSVRTLRSLEVLKRGPEMRVVIEGDAFLYKMCRALVGLLVAVGEGTMSSEDVPRLLDPSRIGPQERSGVIAPAHGLALWKVRYGRGSRP